jgi:hypothetical protein
MENAVQAVLMRATIRQEGRSASMIRLFRIVRNGETERVQEEAGGGQEEIIIQIVQLKDVEIQDIYVFRMRWQV